MVFILFTALLLRVATVAVLPPKNIWVSAAETANVARALATGQGFSSPFGRPTSATAWIAPIYASLLAAIFKLFGVFSRTSATVTFSLQIAISTLTCIPILRLGEELGSRRVGVWAAWGWACYPYFVLLPALFVWETTLSAFLLMCVLLATARLRRGERLSQWALYGALWAISALTNPALLALIPVCGGWLLWAKRGVPSKHWTMKAAVSGCVFVLLMAPWSWRNWRTFHRLLPVRSSFGEALWLGNHPGGHFHHVYGENANENVHELERFQALGEIAYAKARKNAALDYIRSAPRRFVRNFALRIAYWWLAVGEGAPLFLLYAALGLITLAAIILIFWSGASAWYLLAFSILVYPLTYYVTDVMARYRHPVEPAMVLASAYLTHRIALKWEARRTWR